MLGENGNGIVSRRGATECVSVLDGKRVAVRRGASTHVIAWEDVVCVKSANKCTWILTTNDEFKVLDALGAVVDVLEVLGLVRIHRAVAISAGRVRQLVGCGRHRLTVVLDTGARFDVGRKFQPPIRGRFGARRRASTLSDGETWASGDGKTPHQQ